MKKQMLLTALTLSVLSVMVPTDKAVARRFSCAVCENWTDWESSIHRFGTIGDLYQPPYHTEFIYGTCLGGHEMCGGESFLEGEGLKKIQALVSLGDWQALRRLVSARSGIIYNAERNAIQVENCQHEIIAHYQLPMALELRVALLE